MLRSSLPHPIYTRDGMDVCLITKDPQRTFKDRLIANPIPNVTKVGERLHCRACARALAACAQVIGVSKLREKYKQYEERRKLLATFSLFLSDDRVIPLLPALLGSKFFQKKK